MIKQKGKIWIEEDGTEVKISRVSPLEKLYEQIAQRIFKQATDLEARLSKFKAFMVEATEQVCRKYEETQKDTTELQGSHIFYSFDKSIKIETKVQIPWIFNEELIAKCKENFLSFVDSLSGEIGDVKVLKEVFINAFTKRGGKLDGKKIEDLFKYKKQIKNKDFQAMLKVVDEAKSKGETRVYFYVWEGKKVEEKMEYTPVQLNFSSLVLPEEEAVAKKS